MKNQLFIEKASGQKIMKALYQWIDLYNEILIEGTQFKVYSLKNNYTVIDIVGEITNELFFFLVNYLKYPENINYSIEINAFTQIESKDFPKDLMSKQIKIFISKYDEDYDNVYGILETGETYKIDFGGNVTKVKNENNFNYKKTEYSSSPFKVINCHNTKIKKVKNEINNDNFNLRFKRISTISLIVILCFSFILKDNTNYFIVLSQFVAFGTFFWITIEGKHLQYKEPYLKLLGVTILITIWGYYFNETLIDNFWLKASKLSLCYLIVYRILRYIYIIKFKDEPEVDKNADKTRDQIFNFVLLMSSVIMGMLF